MLLRDQTLVQFSDVLASDAPAPGGGSVAALCGALSASLVRMTGGLTVAKEKYKEYHAEIQEIMTVAEKLRQNLLAAIDEDTLAFNKVSAVFTMPKEKKKKKAARGEAMQEALKGAAFTPLETMRAAHECLKLIEKMYGKTNTTCMSDYGTGVLCAIASVRAAWLNVKINISGIKDADFVERTGGEGQKILRQSEKIAEEMYHKIEQDV
jgi:formiminotetrahydrofolate cyclodeaminase